MNRFDNVGYTVYEKAGFHSFFDVVDMAVSRDIIKQVKFLFFDENEEPFHQSIFNLL